MSNVQNQFLKAVVIYGDSSNLDKGSMLAILVNAQHDICIVNEF